MIAEDGTLILVRWDPDFSYPTTVCDLLATGRRRVEDQIVKFWENKLLLLRCGCAKFHTSRRFKKIGCNNNIHGDQWVLCDWCKTGRSETDVRLAGRSCLWFEHWILTSQSSSVECQVVIAREWRKQTSLRVNASLTDHKAQCAQSVLHCLCKKGCSTRHHTSMNYYPTRFPSTLNLAWESNKIQTYGFWKHIFFHLMVYI